MIQTIYCISGLGADEQIFSKLQLTNYRLVFLQWLIPHPTETISSYASRMYAQVPEQNPVMMGVSFGGIICIEIAKLFPVEQLFLVSSAKTKYEIPWWLRLVGKLRIHKLLQPKPHPLIYPIEDFFLGAVTKEEKEVAKRFRQTVNKIYLQWAIDQIVNWQNVTIPPNVIHMHGTKDRVFPYWNVKANHLINGGRHFMVYGKAAEISKRINELNRVAVK
jgi:pimeloyl-ACP methyl ester carboxylesterase